ncbi:MAG: hypothetical protein FWC11_00910 [Firmicutes bacterium]|nr:hypothetical protein [Bacillota bacterium]MCL2255402.1 hypothetical protein [Bacillota bacterium]
MSECKILHIERDVVKKEIVSVDRRGRESKKIEEKLETMEEFCTRAENMVNSYLKVGWKIVSSNYHVPIATTHFPTETNTNCEDAEFIFVLQKTNS